MRRALLIALILSSAALAQTPTTAPVPAASSEPAVQVKNIARIEGARSNQIYGYGLIVGLDGTGDTQQTQFTVQSVVNMLQRFGITVSPDKVKVKNAAAVMVTADLPPFVRPGSKIDVVVSSLGDSRSLQGGTLLQTPLQAANGTVYAVAQGSVSVGGFLATGDGSKVAKNHTTVGRVPEGAIIEQGVPVSLTDGNSINVMLNNPDYMTAVRVAQAIDSKLGAGTATALDAATVQVNASGKNAIALIADIGELSVEESSVAKVIINERTGTVIIGNGVRLSPVAIAHGNLSIEVTQENQVSQPAPLAKTGNTEVVTQTTVDATEQVSRLVNVQPGNTLQDLVKALNELKVTPRDIVSILQALKESGALHAELQII